MKIIGIDGKEYASVKECMIADEKYNAYLKEQEEKTAKEAKEQEEKVLKEKAELTAKKKVASKKVEEATDKVNHYKEMYQQAKIDAKKIIDDANKQAEDMLSDIASKLEEALAERVSAVSEFNREFGPYKTSLTGDDAIKEYNRMVNQFNNAFGRIFTLPAFWKFF